jgi:hypothetical protein
MPSIQLVAAALLGVFAGVAAAGFRENDLPRGLMSSVMGLLIEFDGTAAAMLAILTLLRLMVRPAEDHVAGWLLPYIAAGGKRWMYLFAVAAAVGTAMIAAWLALAVGFATATALVGGGYAPLQRIPMVLLRLLLVILPYGMAGLLLGVITRNAARAVTLVFLSLVVPAMAIIAYVAHTEDLPDWLIRVAYFHVPRMSQDTLGGFLAENAIYVCVCTGLVLFLSESLIARAE